MSNYFSQLSHLMMTYQMETFSALLALWLRSSSVTGESPSQRPVTRSLTLFICAWTNGWVKNRDTGDLRHHRTHYDVTVMWTLWRCIKWNMFTAIPVLSNFLKQSTIRGIKGLERNDVSKCVKVRFVCRYYDHACKIQLCWPCTTFPLMIQRS